MIQVIPSIAINEGKILKLRSGNYLADRIYNESPIDLAREFEAAGVKVIHLADLDGARKGRPVNYHILEDIAGHTSLKIDFSGGISTDGDISKAYEYGASYITAASVAVARKELFASWIISYGREKITLGADSANRLLKIRGWERQTDMDVLSHIQYFYDRGLKYVKTTDVSKEGQLEGPPFDLYKTILDKMPGIHVLANGGVRNIDDVVELDKMGVFAVIIGRALYEGRITLDQLSGFLENINQTS